MENEKHEVKFDWLNQLHIFYLNSFVLCMSIQQNYPFLHHILQRKPQDCILENNFDTRLLFIYNVNVIDCRKK